MLLNIRLKLILLLLVSPFGNLFNYIEVVTATIQSNHIVSGRSHVDIAASLGVAPHLRNTRNMNGIFPLIDEIAASIRLRVSKILNLTKENASQKAKLCRNLVSRLRNTSSADDSFNEWRLDEDIAMAYEYISAESGLWEYVCERDQIKVWKATQPLCVNEEDRRWQCLMAKTTINIPTDALKNLLLDSSKAQQLNRFSLGREDKVILNKNTKIVRNLTKMPFSSKPLDFCTLMHEYVEPRSGVVMIISKAVEHSEVPVIAQHTRAHLIFGLNVLIPSDTPNQTHFISICQAKYAGIHPFLIGAGGVHGTINYIRQLIEVCDNHEIFASV